VTPEVRLRLSLPEGSLAEPDADLPAIDVSSIPGAALLLRRGYRGQDSTTLRVVCAGAPSDRWAPGVEELIMGRVNGVVHGALPGDVEVFEATPLHATGARFEQGFLAKVARPGGGSLSAHGRHTLGFAGEARSAVLCTVVCLEPSAPEGGQCAARIAASSLEGAFTEAPPPSLLIRAILLAAERPLAMLGFAVAVALALITLVLARRPKPRW
jgi:hypothetical protein